MPKSNKYSEIVPQKLEDTYDVLEYHQTDTACAWLVCHSQEGLCKLYSPYPASPEARAPRFFGKPVMRPRIIAGGAPASCGRH